MMMMINLPHDARWLVLAHLPATEIVRCRLVAACFRDTVDCASQEDWRRIYFRQVSHILNVGTSFDWRTAAVVANGHDEAVEALCLWSEQRVLVAVPWGNREDVAVNVPLRRGVIRKSSAYTHVDFEYDNVFRLRGLYRTCLQQNIRTPCINCRTRSKQRCLNPRYDYYIRQLCDVAAPVSLDECLGFRLASHSTRRSARGIS